MSPKIQGTMINLDRKSLLFIGFLFLAILALHPYIHPLETVGLDQNYLGCQWVQMAVFIFEAITFVFLILPITFIIPPRLFLATSIDSFFLFSRAPPSYPS
jgi:hypothetical protein